MDAAESLPLDAATVKTLQGVTTATLTTVLLKHGLRNVWIRGTRPLAPGYPRIVGRAFTLRFVSAREDLATPASWGNPISTRAAIEAMPSGCIAVVGAMGVAGSGGRVAAPALFCRWLIHKKVSSRETRTTTRREKNSPRISVGLYGVNR